MVKEMSRKDVARVADIMGEQSAAAQALADYDRRIAVSYTHLTLPTTPYV